MLGCDGEGGVPSLKNQMAHREEKRDREELKIESRFVFLLLGLSK
jgi:hypothetical protein